jgi:hypothetical protein
MSGLETMGIGMAAAAGIGLGLLSAPKPPSAAERIPPRHERVFAEREAVDGDTPVMDTEASRLHDDEGEEIGCGG